LYLETIKRFGGILGFCVSAWMRPQAVQVGYKLILFRAGGSVYHSVEQPDGHRRRLPVKGSQQQALVLPPLAFDGVYQLARRSKCYLRVPLQDVQHRLTSQLAVVVFCQIGHQLVQAVKPGVVLGVVNG
jgi:hypothetical protein